MCDRLSCLQPQAQLIGDHSDELAVGRLSPAIVNGKAKVGIEHVYVAAIPCYLDGMANGALRRERRLCHTS